MSTPAEGGQGSPLEIIQGGVDLTSVSRLTITGATLAGPANNATLTITGGVGLELVQGGVDLLSVTKLTITGATLAGTAANATLNIPSGGTVTNVATDASLTGGPITTTGTLGIATSAVTNSLLAVMPATTIKGNSTGGSANPTDLTPAAVNLLLPTFTSALKGTVAPSGGGTTNFLRADGTWVSPPGSAGTVSSVATDASLTGGPITTSGTLGIATNAVTNALAAQMPATTIKGNSTAGLANAADLTPAQVNLLLPVFTTSLKGPVPASGGGTANYLRADGTWVTPPGTSTGTVSQVSTDASLTGGPITTTGTLGIATNAVTNALAAQMAANTIKGNNTAGLANAADLTAAQVNLLLPNFTTTVKGDVPASGGGTANFLRADGSWAAPAGAGNLSYQNTVISSLTVGAGITDVILDGVSPTFTLTFPASPADKQVLRVMVATTTIQNFTVAGNGTTVKNSPASMTAGSGVVWEYNLSSTTWYVQVSPGQPTIWNYSSNATWTNPNPAGGRTIRVTLIGPGGGAGSGCSSAGPNSGGGGGGGGGWAEATFDSALLPATVTVTVPAGGAGGIAAAVGAAGVAGAAATSDTTFGAYLTAFRGGGGSGGFAAATSGGGGGAGMSALGPSTATSAGAANGGAGAGAGGTGAAGAAATYMTTGAGGAGGPNGAAGTTGGPAVLGGSGGGSGGGITGANAATNGGSSGSNLITGQASLIGGAGTGQNGRTVVGIYAGCGACGGASAIGGAAGFNGGTGGQGSGGGGGGASLAANTSGVGGNGGPGVAYIVAY